jgi:hypothetical protein
MRSWLRIAALASLLVLPAVGRGDERLDAYFQTLAFERYEAAQAAEEIQLTSACGDMACGDAAGSTCCGPCYTGDFSNKASYLYDCTPPRPDCPPCECPGPDRCCCTRLGWNLWQTAPAWTFRAGAVFIQHERPKATPLIADGTATTVLLDARDFDFRPWQAGFDGSFIRTFAGANHAIEGRYFGVNDFNSRETFTAPATFILNTSSPLLFTSGGPTPVALDYNSNLNSSELNWRCRQNYWLDWLVGARWVQLDESLRMETNAGGPAAAYFNTRNNLYGAQGGFDIRALGFSCPWFLGGTAKAGIYGNTASNNSAISAPGNPLLDAHAQQGVVSFVGELNFAGGYRFNEHVAVRGGYQILWIENTAMAADQVPATNFANHNGINAHGDPLYLGALTGLDITW